MLTKRGQETREDILRILRVQPSATVNLIRDETGKSRTNILYHLERMEAEGIIERSTCQSCGWLTWEVRQ